MVVALMVLRLLALAKFMAPQTEIGFTMAALEFRCGTEIFGGVDMGTESRIAITALGFRCFAPFGILKF